MEIIVETFDVASDYWATWTQIKTCNGKTVPIRKPAIAAKSLSSPAKSSAWMNTANQFMSRNLYADL